jgi:4-amino-4-deoxy-L-arabinose transferase-like glycosyltransferase
MTKLKKKELLLVLFFLVVGFCLRAYRILDTGVFGWDQVQLLKNGLTILQTKPVLIGPQVGPARFFLPPLYYYLTGLFLLIFAKNSWAIYLMPAFISLISGLSIYIIGKEIFSPKAGLIALIISAIAPNLVLFDRIVWNVNLVFVSFLWVFYFLYKIHIKKTKSRLDYLWLGAAIGLAFQAHFTAVLSIPFVLFGLLWQKKNKKLYLFSGLALLISVLPIFIFDLRHNWLNLSAIKNFLFQYKSGFDIISYFDNWKLFFFISVQNFGKIFLPVEARGAKYLGLLLVGLLISYAWKQKDKKLILAIAYWFITLSVFAFYKGEDFRVSPPEYYFFYLLPAFILLTSDLIERFLKKYCLILVVSIFAVLVWLSYEHLFGYVPRNYKSTAKVADYVLRHLDNNPDVKYKLSYIALSKDYTEGLRFLFDRAEVSFDQDSKHEIFIAYPASEHDELKYDYKEADIGVYIKKNDE